MIPGCSRLEIINHIRHQLKLSNFPILVVSAFADELKLDEKMFLIAKPIEIDLFIRTVNKILSQ